MSQNIENDLFEKTQSHPAQESTTDMSILSLNRSIPTGKIHLLAQDQVF